MSAEIISLRRVRKAKERAEREQQARERRAAFGRTKVEKTATAEQRHREAWFLDGHRRDEPKDA